MHKTGPFSNSGVSKFVKLVVVLEVVLEREPGSGSIHFSAYGCIVVYTKHQQLNNTKNYLSLH